VDGNGAARTSDLSRLWRPPAHPRAAASGRSPHSARLLQVRAVRARDHFRAI